MIASTTDAVIGLLAVFGALWAGFIAMVVIVLIDHDREEGP